MKRIILFIFILIVISGFAFAGGKQQSSSTGPKIRLALLIPNMEEQFIVDYTENIKKLAAKQKADLIIQDAKNEDFTQFSQLQNLLAQGCKYFIIIPCVSELSEQMNRLILARGGAAVYSYIPPTTVSLKTGRNFFFVSSTDFEGGRCQGQLIAEYFDRNPAGAPGKILNMILLLGRLGEPAQVYREAGLMAELKSRAYTVKIAGRGSGNWNAEQAASRMNAWISSNREEFNIVVAQNDAMALGAVQSIVQNNLVRRNSNDDTKLTVPVFGFGGSIEAIASMKTNELYATVLVDVSTQSAAAFDLLRQIASGEYKAGNPAAGIPPAAALMDEVPANDPAVISQCYLVPFVPVDKKSSYYRTH